MPAYDTGFKIVARNAGRELARLAGIECQSWEPIVGELQTTERMADRAFRGRQGRQEIVVYMEAYTRWQASAPWSVLAKSGLLSERERLPTVSLIYILVPQGYHPQQGSFRLEWDGSPTQQIWFHEICLWKEEPRAWWEECPGLMPLFPLCKTGRSPEDTISFAANAIKNRADDKIIQADLLATLAIFGSLKYPGFHVLDRIGREIMKQSEVLREFKQSEVLKEFIEEGREETRRADILEAISIRFGPAAAAEFKDSLESIRNLKVLSEIHRFTIKCRRISEFRRSFSDLFKS